MAGTHGGKRPGAGRPSKALDPRTEKVGPLLLTPREREQLEARARERGLSIQDAVRTALRVDGLID